MLGYFFGAASYFTWRVQGLKNKLGAVADGVEFVSGQKVKVVQIVSGHEIAIEYEGKQSKVRMLGITSYAANVNDPLLENVARGAVRYLEENVLHKEIQVMFPKFQKDSYNRILGFIYVSDKDIGLEMVRQGLSLVYSRYTFPREASYYEAEVLAQKERKGIWGIASASARARQLKLLWESEKANENQK